MRVYDYGTTADGYSFLVMQQVSGQTLREILDESGTLGHRDAAEIVSGIANALVSLHAVGLVHRDLKPENVMCNHENGRRKVTLIDLGLVGILEDVEVDDQMTRFTMQGMMSGTPGYIAPEQFGMVAGAGITSKTDAFALGVILYEMLSG